MQMALVKGCPLCEEAHAETSGRATMDLPEFGRLFGISRGKVYELAARDALPVKVIRLGKREVLSRAEVHKMLHEGKADG